MTSTMQLVSLSHTSDGLLSIIVWYLMNSEKNSIAFTLYIRARAMPIHYNASSYVRKKEHLYSTLISKLFAEGA